MNRVSVREEEKNDQVYIVDNIRLQGPLTRPICLFQRLGFPHINKLAYGILDNFEQSTILFVGL